MANNLSFVLGTEYTFRVYNRVFGEQLFILTSGATGGVWDDKLTSGITYSYVKEDGSAYTGDVNFHEAHQKLYSGTTYAKASSEQLDIIQITFTPNGSHPSIMYAQSALDQNMGEILYTISELGDVINPEQYYYMLGVGRDAELAGLSFYETFIDRYISDVLPANVQGKEYET